MQVKVKRPPGTITTLLRTPGCGSGPRTACSKRCEPGRAPEPAGRRNPAGSPGRPRERRRPARFGHSRASGNPCVRIARASPPPGPRGPSASWERGRPARKRAEGPPERRPFAAVVRPARDTAPETRASRPQAGRRPARAPPLLPRSSAPPATPPRERGRRGRGTRCGPGAWLRPAADQGSCMLRLLDSAQSGHPGRARNVWSSRRRTLAPTPLLSGSVPASRPARDPSPLRRGATFRTTGPGP